MRARLVAYGLAVLALPAAVGGCAGWGRTGAVVAAAPAAPAVAAARRSDAREAAKLVSRSVWGVVPDPPRYKKDLKPALIRGSAVAVSEASLLASCRVAEGRARVGIVRHNKYEIARVRAADPGRAVCVLEVEDARQMSPARGYRGLADLRVGEPVYAVVSRTSAEFAVAEGRVTGKRPAAAGARALETSVALPAGARSAVLVDARGNLVGLGSGETRGEAALAAPVTSGAAPRLASRDLGPGAAPAVSLAVLERAPAGRPRLPPVLFRDEPDRDDDGAGEVAAAGARASTVAADDGSPPDEPSEDDGPVAGGNGSGSAGLGGGRDLAGEDGDKDAGGGGGRGGGGLDGLGDGLGDLGGGLGGLAGGDRDDRGRGGGLGAGDDGGRGRGSDGSGDRGRGRGDDDDDDGRGGSRGGRDDDGGRGDRGGGNDDDDGGRGGDDD